MSGRCKPKGYSRGFTDRYSEERWRKGPARAIPVEWGDCLAWADYLEVSCELEGEPPGPGSAGRQPGEPRREMPAVLRVPPLAFLKTIAVLAWSALRYPTATTTVDLFTGDVMSRTW